MSQYDELAARVAELEARDRMQRAILSMVTDPATWQVLLDFHATWKDELHGFGKVLSAFFDMENSMEETVLEELIDSIKEKVQCHYEVYEASTSGEWLSNTGGDHLSH
tara:strand:- start:423 stop:746 length:324 start_codon:yes stop_codon:yes gene_type:complete